MSEANKAIAQRYVEESWNEGNMATVDQRRLTVVSNGWFEVGTKVA